nr:helix-turn-helix transcriptional regulator [Nitrosomonas nitrosa]
MRSVHTDAYRAVLEVLVAARARAGLTQQHVASRLRKPQSFVSKYENGERRLDVAEFIGVLAVLGHDPRAAMDEVLASDAFVRKSGRRAAKRSRRHP